MVVYGGWEKGMGVIGQSLFLGPTMVGVLFFFEKILSIQLFVLLLHLKVFKYNTVMDAIIERKPTSFRLRTDLLERLRRNAIRQNRTLNNYVESILLDIVYNEPNSTTRAAIEEAMSGRNRNKIYASAEEMMNDILNDEG